MPKVSRILVVFALFLFAAIARPQGTVVTSIQVNNGAGVGSAGQSSDNPGGSVGMVGGMIGGFGGSALGGIKGLPFSADVIEENDRYLADGNHIHRENHGKTFRDSEGRTRTESEIGSGFVGSTPFVHIQIMDPVQNVFILLDPQNKVATVHHFRERSAAVTNFTPAPRRPAPAAQSGRTAPTAPPAAPGSIATLTQAGPETQAPRISRQHTREDLGTMEMEGFTVRGTRLTVTTPAGAMGNDKPLISYTEHWFSDELKTDLLIKSNGMEAGEHVRRLVNIRSGDPDPLLFQVPTDYMVKEQQQ